MFAMIASLAFAGAASVAAVVAASTFQESRSRIADAFQGRPLPRIKPMLRGAA